MSAVEAARQAREAMTLVEGETLMELARRLYCSQMEVYSAHAGRDLYQDGDFERLDDVSRQAWLRCAKRKKESI